MDNDTTTSTADLPLLEIMRLLTDETRLQIIAALRPSDRLVGEIVEQTGLAQNLVSYHLGLLRTAGLVQQHRSDVDGRAVYYSLHLARLTTAYRQLGQQLALSGERGPGTVRTVVFLCRANSARSQMAEGWLRSLSLGRLTIRSAGTQPAVLHPLAEQVMAEVGIDIGHQQSKHIDSLAPIAPDLVISVCDIAREACIDWQPAAVRRHWSIADPAAVNGPAQLAAFRAARDELQQRVIGLLALL
jgi:ArsR family transcriptional regulator, arsenate/arsenite/antimonite-responsive transcriptional repressor / arsenate reductase (thioredoxin)